MSCGYISNCGPVGGNSSAAVVLVLFILLVIILRTFWAC